jgi:hypothetical protein
MTFDRPSSRRAALFLSYGAYVAGGVLQWREHELVREPQRWIILALFAVSAAAALFLFSRFDYWRLARSPATLDERERAIRSATYVRAYGLSSLAAICCLAWLGFGFRHPGNSAGSVDFNIVLWGYVLFAATLPSALLAWTSPPSEDERDA